MKEEKEIKNITENPLGSAPMMPLIMKYAVPSIISMLVMSLYNITDQIFIGHVVGMLGNGATNVCFPTVTFSTGISMLFGIGTAANFNIAQGAKRMDDAKKYAVTGEICGAIASLLVFAIIFIFRMPIIKLCGGTEAIIPYAYDYLTITAFGLLLNMFAHATSNLIRADGSPRYSMMVNVVGCGLNVVLDWFFMFPLHMGIKGAAIATVIGQFASLIVAVSYIPKFKNIKITKSDLKVDFHCLGRIMATGAPNVVNHILMMIVNITLNNVLTVYGALSIYGEDIPLAVSGVAAKVNTIMVSISVGLSQGCQPIYGYNMGAGKYDRVKGAYKRAFAIAFLVGVVFFICLQTMPRQIISIFGTGDELYFEFAEKYLKTYMMMVFFQNIQPVTTNYFSGTGKALAGTIVSLSRQGLFLIPLLIFLPKAYGIQGILYASPVSDTLSFILAVLMVIFSFRKLNEEVHYHND